MIWGNESGATYQHTFEVGINPRRPHNSTFKTKKDHEWNFGDPKDCC